MCTTPVLDMPDFSNPFTIESDACDNGLGAVLLQEEHPTAFTSKSLSGKNLAASTYEKEMMAIFACSTEVTAIPIRESFLHQD